MTTENELRKICWRAGERILFFGIGNLGRQDDGLGVLLTEQLESLGLPDAFAVEANYQLNAEDALTVSQFEVVVFVDATVKPGARAPFTIEELKASEEIPFSTHAMSASAVLGLCRELYRKMPRAYVMALPGYDWEINEGLSPQAKLNLSEAVQCLDGWIHAQGGTRA